MRQLSRRLELTVAALIAAYSAVLGGAAGLVWQSVAPKIRLMAALNGSDAANKALLGDDVRLAMVGAVAGALTAVVVLVVGRWAGSGPGASVGLAVGGVLGSLVAARVGHVGRHEDIVRSLHASFPGISPTSLRQVLGYFDFRLGARGVLLVWPFVAVAAHALVLLARDGTGSS